MHNYFKCNVQIGYELYMDIVAKFSMLLGISLQK